MPLWKCADCHHEWEGVEARKCDWCPSDSQPTMLQEKTQFEKFIGDWRQNKRCWGGKVSRGSHKASKVDSISTKQHQK